MASTPALQAGSYRRALGGVLARLASELEDLVVLDADTLRSTGAIEVYKAAPRRVLNLGISEQDLIGTAAGIALAGLRPVVTGFGAFLMRGWEQIRNTVDRDGLNVKIIATHTGLSPHIDGSSHQVLEDLALMRSLARTAVFSPADDVATVEAVEWLVRRYRGPAYVRLGRDNAFRVYSEGGFSFRPGGGEVLLDPGEDATLLATGAMVGVSLAAAALLRSEGVRVGVVDVYSIKPAPRRLVLEAAERSRLLVTVEEHRTLGGLGDVVSSILAEEGACARQARIGVPPGVYGSSSRDYMELLKHLKLDPQSVASRVRKLACTT
ncbi:putative transketolase C-terminal section [Aeropyrum pernix]|uniref:2-oxoacid oxidoreductase (ferredoxin) n=1 Tax=Aeropyrum pernix TaxID=56636 RepID=A0A401H9X1_AERPX|nr:transketolase C-terminal domain-containing protein [Aeropyrum pernix]GBF09256.1 putative transketolase C-terminal section [Aeropyrum pernix]